MLKKIKISQKMNDFTKIISQAKEIEAKIKDSQEKIKNIEATGVSGNNSVKITINGDSEIVNIEISDEAHNEDKNILIDLNLRQRLLKKFPKPQVVWEFLVLSGHYKFYANFG